MEITSFFDWEYLATYAGAMVATGLVTQVLKSTIDKYFNIPTQILAYVVAVIILLLAGFFTGGLDLSTAVLALLNGFIVAAATSGTISGVKRVTTKSSDSK